MAVCGSDQRPAEVRCTTARGCVAKVFLNPAIALAHVRHLAKPIQARPGVLVGVL